VLVYLKIIKNVNFSSTILIPFIPLTIGLNASITKYFLLRILNSKLLTIVSAARDQLQDTILSLIRPVSLEIPGIGSTVTTPL